MNYNRVSLKDGGLEYKIRGGLQVFFWDRLKKQVQKDIDLGKAGYFVFDLAQVSKIDSMGISILVITGKYNSVRGHSLIIKKAPEHIRGIIDSADLKFIEFIGD